METNKMFEFENFNEVDKKIISNIKYGKGNAVTKKELTWITGLCERDIRNRIHMLREKGLIICSCSNKSGYYYPATKEEAIEFHKEMVARIKKLPKSLEKQEIMHIQTMILYKFNLI